MTSAARRTPWSLALGAFPALGTAAWCAALLLPDAAESWATQTPITAIVYLLTFAGPPTATLVVAARRSLPLPAALGLAAGSLVVTWVLIVAILAGALGLACAGVEGECL